MPHWDSPIMLVPVFLSHFVVFKHSLLSLGNEEKREMKKFYVAVANFLNEEDGPTAVEYGVMVALIAAVVIAGATLLGTNTNAVFDRVAQIIGPLAGGGA